jgi:hypothetical protein
MADSTYGTSREAKAPPFEMKDLLRLAIWGTCAAVALAVAVVSINSSSGARRTAAPPAAAETPPPQPVAATETRRLTEMVQVLLADREQILSRLGTLERSLNEVTGSINAEPKPAAPAGAARTELPARVETSAPSPSPVQAVTPSEASGQAGAPVSVRPAEPAEVAAAGLGVDVGGATNFEGLRTLWSSTKHNLPPLPDELYPVIGVRENSKGSADLRLIIGPITSPEVAVRLCSRLAAAHRYCQPAVFLGQRLSLVEPAPKARPAAATTGIADLVPAHHPAPGPRQP